MLEREQRLLAYLLKLRHTVKVKDRIIRMVRQGARWQDCGDGWQALETTIRLSGWTRQQWIILVRESPVKAPVKEAGKLRRGKDRQTLLPHAKGAGWDAQATPWSGKIAVLVTSLDPQSFPATVMPKHYRDRADAENCFDELKNQWGWVGFTSHKLASSRLMAGVRRQIQSGGQRTVKVRVLHEKGDLIAQAVTRTSNELHRIRAITERSSIHQRWTLLLTRLLRRWLGEKWLPGLPDDARLLLSG